LHPHEQQFFHELGGLEGPDALIKQLVRLGGCLENKSDGDK